MKLYYGPGACSLSPHILLREAGLAFDLVRVSTKSHKTEDGGDFYAINPKGGVPVLELDTGERITEGPAIVQYIADLVPEKKLAPPNGTLARTRCQEWLNYLTSEIHKGFSPLFNPSFPEDSKPYFREALLKRFAWVDSQLEGRDYLLGEFSVADAYLFVLSNWGQYVGVDISPFANLGALRGRMMARASVQEAMKAEGLLK